MSLQAACADCSSSLGDFNYELDNTYCYLLDYVVCSRYITVNENASWSLRSRLTPYLSRLIPANQHNVYEEDSEGDIFLQLCDLLLLFRRREQAIEGKGHGEMLGHFVALVTEQFSHSVSNVKRYKTLLDNRAWLHQALTYTQYTFRRQRFRVHHFTLAASQHIDDQSPIIP